MRKQIAICILFVTLFVSSNGQNNLFEYGLHGGVNFNSASGTIINKNYREALTGLHIGGHFKLNTSKQFGIKAILQFDQNGWAYRALTLEDNTGTTIGKGDVLFKLNYLNLPVLADYSFGNKIRFTTGLGLFFGVLLNNQIITKVKQPTASNEVTTTKSSSEFRKPTNFGLSLGAALQIPISSKVKLDFGLHDNYGLANIYKQQGSSGSSLKTHSLSVICGLTFKR